MRVLVSALVAASAAAVLPVAAYAEMSSEPSTTRIETRAFYGATVTIEEGVRVIRPLPPQKHVIVNPDGLTPLSLGYSEVTERNYNYNETHVHDGSGNGGVVGGVVGGLGFVPDGGKGFRRQNRNPHFHHKHRPVGIP